MPKSPATIDDVVAQCIAVRLRKLNRAVTNIYDTALRPLDLKVSQMNILVAAAKLGVTQPASVCRHLHLDASTLSRNVDRMIARGWLQTVPDMDGRAQPFRLTRRGRQLLAKAVPLWATAQEKTKTLLGANVVDELNRAGARIDSA